MGNSVILTENQEMELRKKIDSYVGKIQAEIDSLRADGTDKVISLQSGQYFPLLDLGRN